MQEFLSIPVHGDALLPHVPRQPVPIPVKANPQGNPDR